MFYLWTNQVEDLVTNWLEVDSLVIFFVTFTNLLISLEAIFIYVKNDMGKCIYTILESR